MTSQRFTQMMLVIIFTFILVDALKQDKNAGHRETQEELKRLELDMEGIHTNQWIMMNRLDSMMQDSFHSTE